MVRTVDVGISNWSNNTEGTRNTSCIGRNSTADNKSQGLRKLLTGFCIGQAIVVSAFVIVLAIFVISNTKDIAMLKAYSEAKQGTLSDSTQSEGIEASITSLKTKVQEQETKIKQLEVEKTVINTTLQKVSHRSKSQILELQRRQNTTDDIIEDHTGRISKLAIDGKADQEQIITLNSSIVQLALDTITDHTKLIELGSKITIDSADVKKLNASVTELDLAKDLTIEHIQNLNANMTSLAFEQTLDRADIQNLNASIILLEACRSRDKAEIQNLNTSITTLEASRTYDQEEMQKLNVSITMFEASNTNHQAVIQKVNANITALEASRKHDKAEVQKMNASISKLEIDRTQDQVDMQIMNVSIASLEYLRVLDRDIIDLHNSNIIEIQTNLTTLAESIHNHTLSIVQVINEIDINTDSIQNLSSVMLVLDARSETCMTQIETNSELLSQLDLSMNETQELQGNLDVRLLYIEEIQVGFTVTDPVPWTNSGFIWYLNFSKSVTNTMEGYNITTGVFRCEYPGLYLFTISIARDIGAHSCISCGFKVNHVYTSTAQACGNDLAHPFATNTIVTHLDKGGTVHIECFQALQISSYSTFSGVLLQSKHMA